MREESGFKMTLSVLANVVGGTLLLSAMFVLPYVLSGLFVDFLQVLPAGPAAFG